MLPLKLTIQGLYSYKTSQTIDFEELTKDHLFGIFGAVGSGKSSILDAITYALYGQIERLGQKDALNQNIFNQSAQDFLIDFEFKSGPKLDKYRFVVKNGRRKNGEPKSFERSAYLWESGSWLPLAISDASSIFNLSYDNFRRTVIIPQGKFSDFLQLSGGERTKMMLELFPKLYEFDFTQKVVSLSTENNAKLNTLEGQVLEIGEVQIADIEVKKDEIETLISAIKQLKSEQVDLETEGKKLGELKKLLDEFIQKKNDFKTLSEQKDKFEDQRENLKKYELIFKNFDAEIKILDLKMKTRNDAGIQVESSKIDLVKIEIRQKQEAEKLKELEEKSLSIPNWESELSDLKLLSEKLRLDQEMESLMSHFAKAEKDLSEANDSKNLYLSELKEKKTYLENLESKSDQESDLLKAMQFFKEKRRISDELEKKKQELSKITENISQLKEKKDKLLEARIFETIADINGNSKIKEIIVRLSEEKESLRSRVQNFQEHFFDLGKKEQLFHFSIQMADGEPCPLCGAEHHPDVVNAEDVTEQQKQTQNQMDTLNLDVKEVEKISFSLQEISSQLGVEVSSEKKLNEDLENVGVQAQNLLSEFSQNPFFQFEEEEVSSRFKHAEEIKKQILDQRNSVKKLEARLEAIDLNVGPLRDKENELKQGIAALKGKVESYSFQIKNPDFGIGLGKDEIDIKLKSISLKINETKSLFEAQSLLFQEIGRTYASNQATSVARKEAFESIENELNLLSVSLEQKVEKENLGSLPEIRLVLAQPKDTDKLKSDLAAFFDRLLIIGNEVKILTERIGNQEFDENIWKEVQGKILESQRKISEEDGRLGALKDQLQILNVKLNKLDFLQIEKKKLEERKENLAVLNNLFRGSAFVNFVSSIYLENVVQMANQRFFRLTRQKLSLELGEDNTFYVIDYLNNGHKRLAKTMSGGQIFQASLSLALALADIVRNLTRSDKNFFFLDEGFGSLDKESLHLVFDTLRQLRQEDRIVGVISHIEEMQQEIDNCLKIRMDDEKGSIIEVAS